MTPKTSTVKPTLTRNAPFRTRWSVQVPEDAVIGEHALSVDVSHHSPGSRCELRTGFDIAVRVAQPPPSGTLHLSDASWLTATNGYGPVERETSDGGRAAGDGRTIAVQGKTYAKGPGTNAPSTIRYRLGGECTRFTTDGGLDGKNSDHADWAGARPTCGARA